MSQTQFYYGIGTGSYVVTIGPVYYPAYVLQLPATIEAKPTPSTNPGKPENKDSKDPWAQMNQEKPKVSGPWDVYRQKEQDKKETKPAPPPKQPQKSTYQVGYCASCAENGHYYEYMGRHGH